MDNLAPARDLDISFDDGNIILEVEKTLFKVHRSILASFPCFQKKIFDEKAQFYQNSMTIPRLTCHDNAAHVKIY